ncbi:MAG TPA: hypothetical protein VFQ35_22950 [Polyangiaceae bacterium]|nr:hypothetical protein [Polyangiaceae bacterium]
MGYPGLILEGRVAPVGGGTAPPLVNGQFIAARGGFLASGVNQ